MFQVEANNSQEQSQNLRDSAFVPEAEQVTSYHDLGMLKVGSEGADLAFLALGEMSFSRNLGPLSEVIVPRPNLSDAFADMLEAEGLSLSNIADENQQVSSTKLSNVEISFIDAELSDGLREFPVDYVAAQKDRAMANLPLVGDMLAEAEIHPIDVSAEVVELAFQAPELALAA